MTNDKADRTAFEEAVDELLEAVLWKESDNEINAARARALALWDAMEVRAFRAEMFASDAEFRLARLTALEQENARLREGMQQVRANPHAEPERCEHPYLNRIYRGEGEETPYFDCPHCGTEFHLPRVRSHAARAGAPSKPPMHAVCNDSKCRLYGLDLLVNEESAALPPVPREEI